MSEVTYPQQSQHREGVWLSVGSPHREGVWEELLSQDARFRRVLREYPLPMQLLKKYAQLAVRGASIEQLDDGTWYAQIVRFPGVWSCEPSAKEALDVLEEVVFDWVLLKIIDQDRDLPVIEGIDLNTI